MPPERPVVAGCAGGGADPPGLAPSRPETINELMASLEENEKAIRDMNEKRGLIIYTNHEICDVLGINEKLLRKYRYNGLLSYSKCGDKYWYTQTDIDEFMAKNKREAFY